MKRVPFLGLTNIKRQGTNSVAMAVWLPEFLRPWFEKKKPHGTESFKTFFTRAVEIIHRPLWLPNIHYMGPSFDT